MPKIGFIGVFCALLLWSSEALAANHVAQGEFYEARAGRYMRAMEQVIQVARDVEPLDDGAV